MGQAGVGKTTLALRYLELARKQGMAVARASATRASQALPFGALAPVLPPDPDGDDLGRENQTELLRRYGRAVAETAGGARSWYSSTTRICWMAGRRRWCTSWP